MKRLSVLLVAILAGCSAPSSTGEEEADNRGPLVCFPEHTQLPCTAEVEEGVAYRFNLLTHCGIQWAYFNGHYWVPKPRADTPRNWESMERGTMVLERRGHAVFETTKGGTARFVTAAASYRPPNCE